MISLKEWMEVVGYRITEGSEGYYHEFGPNCHCLSAWNGDHNGWSFNIVFDTKDQTVYIAEACDYKNQRAYRLINPDYKQAYMKSIKKEDWRDQAWDDVNFVDLEVDDDWIQKALAIVAGDDYDTHVSIPLNLDKENLHQLMLLAHENDLTLNQYVEKILRAEMGMD